MMEDDILAPFLKPVRDITQNFDINLVELLEDYLNKIGISDTEAEAVLDSKTFAEAAIMLQQSANIYGKKVDYLWQLLMQVLQKNKLAGQKTAADKRDGKKQPDEYFSQEFCEIDDETLFCGDVDINVSAETFSEIKFLPKYNPQLEATGSDERNLMLYGPQTNTIGQKYEFRVNRYLSSEGLLVDEPVLLREIRSFCECDTSSKLEEILPVEGMISEDEGIDVGNCHIFEPIHDRCSPVNVNGYSKSRCSKDGSRRESSTIINICENAWKPWPFDKVVPNKRFVKKVTFKVPPDLVNVADEEVKRKVFDVRMEKRQSCSSILSFMTTNFERRALKGNDYFMDIEYSNLLHGLKNSQPDEDMPSLSKLQAEFDEMAKKLAEEFEDVHYGSDDDETRGKEEGDNCSVDENFDEAEEDNLEDFEMYINDIKFPILNQLGEELQNELVNPPILENDLAYEQYALETCRVIPLETELLQGISSKVREWHDKIRPRLKAATERGHFDINAYRKKIVNSFPDVGVASKQSTLSFGDIVKDETTEDVPRFFLAALMMANSYNVELSKSDESHLEMDCVNLTLLNPVLNSEYGNTEV